MEKYGIKIKYINLIRRINDMRRRVYSIILLFATLITAFFTLPVDVYAIQNEKD